MNIKPTPKVGAAGLAGALSIIIVWGVQAFSTVTIPAEVASAFTTVLTFGAGWLVKE